jgi:hypothetical protein
MRRLALAIVALLGIVACARAVRYTAHPELAGCRGARILELTNGSLYNLRVGWVPDSQVHPGRPLDLHPRWLGVAAPGVDTFAIPEPGQLIFVAPDSARHVSMDGVSHRVLCGSAG